MAKSTNLMSVTEWINNCFGVEMKEPALEGIKDFSLIWNVFEDHVCCNNFCIGKVQKLIAKRHFNPDFFTTHFNYFKNSYVRDGKINDVFTSLNFRPGDREEFVSLVLLGKLADIKDILLTIEIIVYRFRCNLFHGHKDIKVIDQQQKNFETANLFLMSFLDQYLGKKEPFSKQGPDSKNQNLICSC